MDGFRFWGARGTVGVIARSFILLLLFVRYSMISGNNLGFACHAFCTQIIVDRDVCRFVE